MSMVMWQDRQQSDSEFQITPTHEPVGWKEWFNQSWTRLTGQHECPSEIRRRNVSQVDSMAVASNVAKVTQKVGEGINAVTEGAIAVDHAVVASKVVSGVTGALSLKELREALERIQKTGDGKERLDSIFTTVVELSKVTGGLSSLIGLVDEAAYVGDMAGACSGALITVSGLLSLVGAGRLVFRWKDVKELENLIVSRVHQLKRLESSPIAAEDLHNIRTEIFAEIVQELSKQDPVRLHRTLKLNAEDVQKVDELAQRLLAHHFSADDEATFVLEQLGGRVKVHINSQRMEMAATAFSLAGLGLLFFSPLGVTAQVVGGVAGGVSVARWLYEYYKREDLFPEQEYELESLV